ncbi:hypothetical protein [Acinetobacter proteolyticus]|uniref:Uncharacterized protein n=1 Tax=Acinetobacter proteolyticus TaxID=1776741 RepID=A0A2N0WI79_9GAMM|nr:hypothetical protein [Acinetobacter proteolyticus]PKF35502.1 hypothetical protein CW311_04225 [Acinetobacter proteolyticus]
MSLWLDATVCLSDKLHPLKSPLKGVKATFKKHGIDFDEKHFEGSLKLDAKGKDILVSICNPDGYVDEIHAAFKDMVKQAWVGSISIESNYYM